MKRRAGQRVRGKEIRKYKYLFSQHHQLSNGHHSEQLAQELGDWGQEEALPEERKNKLSCPATNIKIDPSHIQQPKFKEGNSTAPCNCTSGASPKTPCYTQNEDHSYFLQHI
jgi:hypothetical protein